MGSCFMDIQIVYKRISILVRKEIIEVFPMRNLLRCLPQRDQKMPGGI